MALARTNPEALDERPSPSSGLKLYEIAGELQRVVDEYNSVETDEELTALEATLGDLSLSFNDKAIGVALHIVSTEATVTAIASEVARLSNLVVRNQKRADWFREYLKRNMEATGIEKIDGGKVTLKIKKNPASVIIEDETVIPDEYRKRKEVVTIDKTAIKESWAKGIGVAGSKIDNQRTRLEIK